MRACQGVCSTRLRQRTHRGKMGERSMKAKMQPHSSAKAVGVAHPPYRRSASKDLSLCLATVVMEPASLLSLRKD